MSKVELTKANLETHLQDAVSLRDLLKRMGYAVGGANAKLVKAKMDEYGLSLNDNKRVKKTLTLDQILVVNSPYTFTNDLKKKLIKAGLIANKCVGCGLKDTWFGKPITLQLDHINGNSSDNRLENLRMLCPNCHSQTTTWGGRNVRR